MRAQARPARLTVRLRLTLLYGGLFLASGTALLGITYLLESHFIGRIRITTAPLSTHGGAGQLLGPTGRPVRTPPSAVSSQIHRSYLHQLLLGSAVALLIMVVVSLWLGWLVAGRVLRPLRTMTATTRRISEENLHERLALSGRSDELTELGDTIDGLLGRLEAAFVAQRRFVANASHELRTPLAMIRTSVDVAAGKPGRVPPEVDVLAGKVRRGLDQADRLIESFLVLARAQQGTLTNRTRISLPRTVAAVLATRQPAAGEAVQVRQDPGVAEVVGSETLLNRMVANLVDNALRHGGPGGAVRVATAVDGGTVRLVVENGGARLDDAEVRRLGQPFQRLGANRTASDKGVGLGLSIVAAIATAHRGSLRLHTRPEGGLRAVVELPRASVAAPAPVLAGASS